MTDYTPNSRSDPHTLHRFKHYGHYDEETINTILDRGLVAHVTFRLPPADFPGDAEDDWPVVIPMAYARVDTTIYMHGHLQSRLLSAMSVEKDGAKVKACLTVTHVHGLVLALTPFNHSFNYSSVVLLGHSRLVTDPSEKEAALIAITNAPFKSTGGGNRWADCRPPSEVDVKSTKVVAFDISYATAKISEGPPKDDKKDLENREVTGKYWTGVVTREEKWAKAIPSSYSVVGLPLYVQDMFKQQ